MLDRESDLEFSPPKNLKGAIVPWRMISVMNTGVRMVQIFERVSSMEDLIFLYYFGACFVAIAVIGALLGKTLFPQLVCREEHPEVFRLATTLYLSVGVSFILLVAYREDLESYKLFLATIILLNGLCLLDYVRAVWKKGAFQMRGRTYHRGDLFYPVFLVFWGASALVLMVLSLLTII